MDEKNKNPLLNEPTKYSQRGQRKVHEPKFEGKKQPLEYSGSTILKKTSTICCSFEKPRLPVFKRYYRDQNSICLLIEVGMGFSKNKLSKSENSRSPS
jgi:hypothetical protein